MDRVSGQLQVFFEAPFWVGIFERISEGKLSVCKVTFGAEPKDIAVLQFTLQHYDALRFGTPIGVEQKCHKRVNPKRTHREVKRQVANVCMGTKSQQALKLQREQDKQARKDRSRKQQEEARQLRFLQKQQKKKEKHKGR